MTFLKLVKININEFGILVESLEHDTKKSRNISNHIFPKIFKFFFHKKKMNVPILKKEPNYCSSYNKCFLAEF